MFKSLNLFMAVIAISFLFFNACDKNNDAPNDGPEDAPNNAPEIFDQGFSIEENSPDETVIGTVIADDNDKGQKLLFKIVNGNEDGAFDIDPESGRILVANTQLLDFEQTEQFFLTISVTDNHEEDPLESSAEVQIDILNVNEIPQDGIQAYYDCNNNANDNSGYYNFADPGLTYGTDRKNTTNETFIFNGSQGLKLLSQDFNNQSNPQSVSLWFKTASPNNVDYGGLLFGLFGVGDAGTGSRFFVSMNQGFVRGGYGDEWTDNNKWNESLEWWGVALNDNEWHHLVFITNGDNQMAYLIVDNVLVLSKTLSKSNNYVDSVIDFKIGGDKAENYFTGELDEIIYYQRALTASEVNTIYLEK